MEDVFRYSVRRTRMLMQLLGGVRGPGAPAGRDRYLRGALVHGRPSSGARSGSAWRSGPSAAWCSARSWAHGLKLACAGLVAGLAGALVLTRLMETLLFAVCPNDPVTLAGVAALIAAVAAAASLIPAFGATRVDPLVALKDE